MSKLLYELILQSAERTPDAAALRFKRQDLDYADLAAMCARVAGGLLAAGLARGERVAVYLPKQPETVAAMFGASAAGCVFVPVNPALKPAQVAHILGDCEVRCLVTSAPRLAQLEAMLAHCPALRQLVIVGDDDKATQGRGPTPGSDATAGGCAAAGAAAGAGGDNTLRRIGWDTFIADSSPARGHRVIDADIAAILYTSGSTGQPKGVVLSHANMVTGADSVASYLENRADDRLLAVLPFSFDYGFSQLSTAFLRGACTVLMDYLMPRDVLRAVARDSITGLAAVPPLWIELARLEWPDNARSSLRYITNSGGAMPRTTVAALRRALPDTQVFLMYGLTEAFRSTYLPPEEVKRRPDSMGRAIPNAEILVLREDGSPCAPGEPGELVHRGALVALGYWNDPERSRERFRPLPASGSGLPFEERAVWSGDTVRYDEEGFLYFVGRRDEMIKTSGYRVSPTEIEEAAFRSGLIAQAAAFGVPHVTLGQSIVLAAVAVEGRADDTDGLLAALRVELPGFMVPAAVQWHKELPRNPNGKIDRKTLAATAAETTA